LGGPQTKSARFVEENKFLSLPGIEPQIFHRTGYAISTPGNI